MQLVVDHKHDVKSLGGNVHADTLVFSDFKITTSLTKDGYSGKIRAGCRPVQFGDPTRVGPRTKSRCKPKLSRTYKLKAKRGRK